MISKSCLKSSVLYYNSKTRWQLLNGFSWKLTESKFVCWFHWCFDSVKTHIFSFWIYRLLLFPQSWVKPIQMKSSMTYIQTNGCTKINIILTKRWQWLIWVQNSFKHILLVPYRWNRGDFRFPRRLSLCPSVCLSIRLSVCQSTQCPSSRFSELFSVVLWDIDLKFGMWIRLDLIQIKFEFRYAWPTFTAVIALCWNLVFRVFLWRLLWYWLEIWYMNLSWHNTDQVRVLLRMTYFYGSYCPLLKFSFPDFSLLSFEILTWNVVYEFVLTSFRSSSSFITFDLLL